MLKNPQSASWLLRSFLTILCFGLTAKLLSSQTIHQKTPAPDLLAPDTIDTLSDALSQDVQIGDAELGRIRAMQLYTALYASSIKHLAGTSTFAELQTKYSKISSVSPTRLIPLDPAATAPFADQVAQVRAAIQASDLNRSYSLLNQLEKSMGDVVRQEREAQLASSGDALSQHILESIRLKSLLIDGNVSSAEALAQKVLSQSMGQPQNVADAENIYNANDALGRGALMRNDLDAAQKYLMLAASTPGNSHLNSHGPNLYLAKSLLDLGYKETVVSFLTSCKAWWTNPKIDVWMAQIRQGQTPDLAPYSRIRF